MYEFFHSGIEFWQCYLSMYIQSWKSCASISLGIWIQWCTIQLYKNLRLSSNMILNIWHRKYRLSLGLKQSHGYCFKTSIVWSLVGCLISRYIILHIIGSYIYWKSHYYENTGGGANRASFTAERRFRCYSAAALSFSLSQKKTDMIS